MESHSVLSARFVRLEAQMVSGSPALVQPAEGGSPQRILWLIPVSLLCSSVIPSSCGWSGSCAALSWSASAEAGWPWMSS